MTNQPEARLLALNLDLLPAQGTAAAAAAVAAPSLWQPFVLVGPIPTVVLAERFLQEWNSTGGRSLEKRCDTADKLAQKYHYACYTLRAGVENDLMEEGDSEVLELAMLPTPRGVYMKMYRRLALAEGRKKRGREGEGEKTLPPPKRIRR
jgi:hypothetical protein